MINSAKQQIHTMLISGKKRKSYSNAAVTAWIATSAAVIVQAKLSKHTLK
jgi:hypothetical protein